MNYLGFEQDKLETVTQQLNNLLASYQIYYQNLRNFHWNVQGENFFDLHNRFELLYTDAREKIDEIAERILTLRNTPLSRMSDYLANSDLEEAGLLDDDRNMVLNILANHKILIRQIREVLSEAGAVKDEGTVDMMGSYLENLEKQSWMLDAWATRRRTLTAS